MSDSSDWWFNRLGTANATYNPSGGVPSYGLVVDTATGPWESSTAYDNAVSLTREQGMAIADAIRQSIAPVTDFARSIGQAHKSTLWDRATDATSGIHASGTGILGVEGGETALSDEKKRELREETPLGQAVTAVARPVAEAGEQVWDKALTRLDTPLLAIRNARQEAIREGNSWDPRSLANLVHPSNWADAYDEARVRTVGQSFIEGAILDDKDLQGDLDYMRKHSTWYNVGSFGLDFAFGWKFSPDVLLGRGVGAVQAARAGKIPANKALVGRENFASAGRLKQRNAVLDVLKAPDDAAAEAVASKSPLSTKIASRYGMNLRRRSDRLFQDRQTMNFEDFAELPMFREAPNGPQLANAFWAAGNDKKLWDLSLRMGIGDNSALDDLKMLQSMKADELRAFSPNAADYLDALEATKTRARLLDKDLKDLEASITSREKSGNTGGFFRYETWLERTDAARKMEDLAEVTEALSKHQGYAEWQEQAHRWLQGGSQIDRVSAVRRGGNTDPMQRKVFKSGQYGPAQTIERVARAPWLKKPGIVDLNRPEESYRALANWWNQAEAVTGYSNPAMRDSTLRAFAASGTDVERRKILEALETEIMPAALSHKYAQRGVSIDSGVIKDVIERGKNARGKLFSDVQERTSSVGLYDTLDENGQLVSYQLPVSPTELKNYFATLDLQELDAAIRRDPETWSMLDSTLKNHGRAAYKQVMNGLDATGYWSNRIWKPLVLLRLSWPMRVIPEQGLRAMFQTDNMLSMAWMASHAMGRGMTNTFLRRPYQALKNGKKYHVGPGPLGNTTSHKVTPVGGSLDIDLPQASPHPSETLTRDLIAESTEARRTKLEAVGADITDYSRAMDINRAMVQKPDLYPGRTPSTPQSRFAAKVEANTKAFAALSNDGRTGVAIDPASLSTTRNGYLVPVAPERDLVLQPRPGQGVKPPTAEQIGHFVKKNSDLLSARSLRVIVRKGEDGKYVLSMGRHFGANAQAKAGEFAERANTGQFWGLNKGKWEQFDREVAESPEALPTVVDDIPDDQLIEIGDEIIDGLDFKTPIDKFMEVHAPGKGFSKYRTADGRIVEVPNVYEGDDIRMGINSGAPVWENAMSGYSRAKGAFDRANAKQKVYTPPAQETLSGKVPARTAREAKEYFRAWTHVLNRKVKFDPIFNRMLRGQSDEQIVKWLRSNHQDARDLRKRMPWQAYNPERWVSNHRRYLTEVLPSSEAQKALLKRNLTSRDLTGTINQEHFPVINTEDLDTLMGEGPISNAANRLVQRAFHFFGTLPDDQLTRHPMAAILYKAKMRDYLTQNPSDTLTPERLNAAQAAAREYTTKQIRRTFYNLMDESNFTAAMRYIGPFTNAWAEVFQRWARIISDRPETFARMAYGWDTLLNENPFVSVNYGDQKVELFGREYGPEDEVTIQIPEWLHVPGLKWFDGFSFRKGSANTILQGDNWWLPSLGPVVTLPTDKLMDVVLPEGGRELGTGEGLARELYDWAFPVGRPKAGVGGLVDSLSPAWARRATAYVQGEGNAEFQNEMNEIARQMMTQWQLGGRKGPKPTMDEIREAAKNHALLRIWVSFGSPFPVDFKPKYQFYIDEYRKMMERYGPQGDKKFIEKYGMDYFALTQSLSASDISAPASAEGLRESGKYKDLIRRHPEFSGMIFSPDSFKDTFDPNVYQYQFEQEYAPGDTIRRPQPTDEWMDNNDKERGWWLYESWRHGIDAELERRGLETLSNNGAEDLAVQNNVFKQKLMQEYPAWAEDYSAREASIGSRITELQDIAFDKRMDSRPDMQGLRQYLLLRQDYAAALDNRYLGGGSRNLEAEQNGDLKAAWDYQVNELVKANPMFADLYYRWLENDTLQTGGGL